MSSDSITQVALDLEQHARAGSASVRHLFRVAGDRIAELWNVAQPLPAESPNADGMFQRR